MPAAAHAPVGIFDSGLGGLSVLRHIRARLPHENLVYFADSAYAPYGGRPEAAVLERTMAVAGYLAAQQCKALVIACNTATAAAVAAVRERYPLLPVVGVEPGLKPAALGSASRVVGVLATARTLASARFQALESRLAATTGVRFVSQACSGLADQVEKGELRSPATAALVRRYVEPLVRQGADTLVLGCTHYPFLLPLIADAAARAGGHGVMIVDTGEAVARQLARVLAERTLLRTMEAPAASITACTTGSASTLENGLMTLLGIKAPVSALAESRD
nr:glutamate racemase [uncultured Noviherbaspirillum sp.]